MPPRPGRLLLGWRKRVELSRIVVRDQWKFHLGVVALVLGVVGLVVADPGEPVGFGTGIAGVVLGVVLMVPDVRARVREHADIRLLAPPEVYVSPMPLSVDPDATVVTDARHPGSRAVVWDGVDAAIADARLPCRLVDPPRPPLEVERHRAAIVAERLRGADVFNGKVVGQADDLTPALLAAGGPVALHVGRYFDLVATNYMTNWSFGPAVGLPTQGWTLSQDEETGHVLPLAGSALTNAIGVSTLAFTADGRLVLVGQANRNMSSPGTWAPSGSGSLDDRDLAEVRRGRGDLVGTVVHAMERELCEEAHLDVSEVRDTTAVGYFRWVNQGAKPEYLGVSRLTVTSATLRRRLPRWEEVPFVRRIDPTVRLDVAALAAAPDTLAGLPEPYAGTASFPLFMALRALGRRVAVDDDLRSALLTR